MSQLGTPGDEDEFDDLDHYFKNPDDSEKTDEEEDAGPYEEIDSRVIRSSGYFEHEKACLLSQVYDYQEQNRFCYILGRDDAQQIAPIDTDHHVESMVDRQMAQGGKVVITDIRPVGDIKKGDEPLGDELDAIDIFSGSRELQDIADLSGILRAAYATEGLEDVIPEMVEATLQYHIRIRGDIARCRRLISDILVQPDDVLQQIATIYLQDIQLRNMKQYLQFFPDDTLAELAQERTMRTGKQQFYEMTLTPADDITTPDALHAFAEKQPVMAQGALYIHYLDTLSKKTPDSIIHTIVIPLCSLKKFPVAALHARQTMKRLGYTYNRSRQTWKKAEDHTDEE